MSSTGAAERSWLGEILSRIALPLAFLTAAATRAAFLVDPADAAELRFLALVGTVALVGIASLDSPDQVRTAVIALLAELGLWALPAGEVRSAGFSGLLVLAIALGTWERVRAGLDRLTFEPIAWALAVQAVFRPELYLAPRLDAGFIVEAIVCPTLVALAVLRLGLRDRAWLAILAIVLVEGGFSPEIALTLVILAASRALPGWPEAAAWIACALALLPASSSEPISLLLLVSVALVAALLLANRGATALIATFALATVSPALATGAAAGSLRAVVLGIVVLPLAVWPSSGRRLRAATGLALAAVAGFSLPPGAALAAPLVAVASALPDRGERVGIQASWLGFMALLGGIVASFPWLRPQPLESVLRWLGPGVGLQTALLAVLVFWLVAAMARSAWIPRPVSVATLGVIVIAAGVLGSPRRQTVLGETLVLDTTARARTYPLDLEIRHLTVDSYASNTTRLIDGAPIGRIVLEIAGGGELSLPLSLGRETGEWAAKRPGLDAVVTAPTPWVSWLAPDGPYLAQRYRASWTLDSAVAARGFRIELDDSLPTDVSLAVFRVGAR